MIAKHALTLLIVVSLTAGSVMLARSGYFYAKGLVAQQLLSRAWERSKRSGRPVEPWDNADIFPVARLTIHAIGLSRVVLEEADKRSLSFGPAHISVSAGPGTHGNIAIAGHRDSFFRGLQRIQEGDVIELESLHSIQRFQVSALEVTAPEDTQWVERSGEDVITLLTCYPFDYTGPAPKRYVVRGRLLMTEEQINLRG